MATFDLYWVAKVDVSGAPRELVEGPFVNFARAAEALHLSETPGVLMVVTSTVEVK